MTTPNNPQNPIDLSGLLGNKIVTAVGQELVNGLLSGGVARRGVATGLNLVKEVKLGEVFSAVESMFEEGNAAARNAAAAKDEEGTVHIPFKKADSTPASTQSPAPAQKPEPEVKEEVTVVKVTKPVVAPAPADPKVAEEANQSIDTIYTLATTKLSAEEQSQLVTSVMNLVRLASPEGFTGEHVRWLSRLYGNKSI